MKVSFIDIFRRHHTGSINTQRRVITEEFSAKGIPALSKPEASHNPSRWLSPVGATPPEKFLQESHSGRGATSVRPLPGSMIALMNTGGVAPRGRVAQPPARIVKSLRDLKTLMDRLSQRAREGRMKFVRALPIKRPSGTRFVVPTYPAINRRAIFKRPAGTWGHRRGSMEPAFNPLSVSHSAHSPDSLIFFKKSRDR
jgi:hypothetical protein